MTTWLYPGKIKIAGQEVPCPHADPRPGIRIGGQIDTWYCFECRAYVRTRKMLRKLTPQERTARKILNGTYRWKMLEEKL